MYDDETLFEDLPVPTLKKGRVLRSDMSGDRYRVTSDCVGAGGFGRVYRGQRLDDSGDPVEEVAIKVVAGAGSWHGEAYFGRLLAAQPRVVRFIDSFQLASGSGSARLVGYFLIFEWMDGGTINDFFEQNQTSIPEHDVELQLGKLLELLSLLHRRGICHGDITPRNVFVRDGDLVLGDLGIAKQGLYDGPIPMDGAAPPVFSPPDRLWCAWTPSDDVYQLALIGLSALAGEVVESSEVCTRLLKSVSASDHLKGWVRDALAVRRDRFLDAADALDALRGTPVKPARPPRSLRGQRVVFTGKLHRVRAEAKVMARGRDALVQDQVNGTTTLIVAGEPNPLQIGQKAGTKLFDAHRRIRRGNPSRLSTKRGSIVWWLESLDRWSATTRAASCLRSRQQGCPANEQEGMG